jgi:hypothetical protein
MMSEKYTPMSISCDFTLATFKVAMTATWVPIYLHVHPSMVERANEIVDDPLMAPGRRIKPKITADDTLNVNEWYLVTSIGSDPP